MVDYVDFARVRELPEFATVDTVYFVQPNAGDPVRQFITGDDAVPVEIAAATAAQQLFDAGLIDAPTVAAMSAYLQGPPGTAATVTATATTGTPGTPVTVTNGGTPTNRTLAFTIPRGDTGPASTVPGPPGQGGNIVSGRTGLAALPVVAGATYFMNESGRSGQFEGVAGNQSALVASDPDQALYVAPTAASSGSSGVWRRLVTDNVFQARWWGEANTTANSNAERDRAQRMVNLLPSFAVLAWWSANIITKEDVVIAKPLTINFNGFGIVRDPTSGLQGGPTWNMLVLAASDITINDPFLSGQKSVQASANPGAILVSTRNTASSRPLERININRPRIRDCTLGIVTYGDWQDVAQREVYPVTSVPFYYPTDVTITRPDIECNYMGIELFYGVRNIVRQAKIKFFEQNGASGFHPGIRPLGTTDCLIEDFDIDCNNAYGAADSGSWGFYVAIDNGRQRNKNLTIRRGFVRNCAITFRVDECMGYLRIEDVETFNPLDANIRRYGLSINATENRLDIRSKVENLVHTGCRYNGVSLPYELIGYITHEHSENNVFIGNEFSEPDLTAIMFNQFGTEKQKKTSSHVNEKFLLKPGPSYRLVSGVTPIGADSFLRFENCLFPEGTTGTNPADTTFMETSPANIVTSVTDPGTVNATVPKGSCGRYPVGAWAARLP